MTNGYDEQGMPIEKLSGPLNWEAYFSPEVLQIAAANMDLVTKMNEVAYKSYDVHMWTEPGSSQQCVVHLRSLYWFLERRLKHGNVQCGLCHGEWCAHETIALMKFEEVNGRLEWMESSDEFDRRKADCDLAQKCKKRDADISTRNELIPVLKAFEDKIRRAPFMLYNMDKILDGRMTNRYYVDEYKKVDIANVTEKIDRGEHRFQATFSAWKNQFQVRVQVHATTDRLSSMNLSLH